MTDRNGSTHTLTYDVLGRVVSDAVTTLGSGVDGSVRRVETAYDGQGNAYRVTSYDAASSGSIVNQVQRAFNGLGQLVTEWQEHGGAVNTSTSQKVQYAYAEMPSGADHSRLASSVPKPRRPTLQRLKPLSIQSAPITGTGRSFPRPVHLVRQPCVVEWSIPKAGHTRRCNRMGWDKDGRYYTRSRRVNGHVVREHVGGGMIGELAAEADALTRAEREAERIAARTARDQVAALDAPLAELNELADLLARAALATAGYAQHHRGAWRKTRG